MGFALLRGASDRKFPFRNRDVTRKNLSRLGATYAVFSGDDVGMTMLGNKWYAQAATSGVANLRYFNGIEDSGVLFEPPQTNLILYSSESNAAWVSIGTSNTNSRSSIIDGKTAPGYTGATAADGKRQAYGTFDGGNEVCYFIVEKNTATSCGMFIYDASGPATVSHIDLNFDTGVVSQVAGSSSAKGAKKLSDSGPNGGVVYLLWQQFSGTASNTRWAVFYPDRDGNGDETILHHAQGVVGDMVTSPIVTTSASQERGQDNLEFAAPVWADESATSVVAEVETLSTEPPAGTGDNLIAVFGNNAIDENAGMIFKSGNAQAFKTLASADEYSDSGVDMYASGGKAAVSVQSTPLLASGKGNTTVSTASATGDPTGFTKCYIGGVINLSNPSCVIKNIQLIPAVLTAAQLEDLSS